MEDGAWAPRTYRLKKLLSRARQVGRLDFHASQRRHSLGLVAGLACGSTALMLAIILVCRGFTAERPEQLRLLPPGHREAEHEAGSSPIFPPPRMPVEQRLPHLSRDPTKCPLQHDRIPYEAVRDWRAQAYLLGGRAQPKCHNCDSKSNWSQFCQFRSAGPVCPDWLKWQLTRDWIDRAELGAPGARERLTMTPCDLFPFLRNRTLWIVGDSLSLNWHKALACFLFEFWDLELTDAAPHPELPPGFQGWCAALAQGARLCFLRANTGQQFERLLPLLPLLGATPADLMVMNFAVWANTPAEYAAQLNVFAKAFYQHRAGLPEALWRDAASQHFAVPSGDFRPDGSRGSVCQAVEGVRLQPDNSLLATDASKQEVADGGWRNRLADPVVAGLGLPVVRTWNESLWLWQYHLQDAGGKLDCTHMCHPSAYQHWVWLLLQTLRRLHPELATPAWA